MVVQIILLSSTLLTFHLSSTVTLINIISYSLYINCNTIFASPISFTQQWQPFFPIFFSFSSHSPNSSMAALPQQVSPSISFNAIPHSLRSTIHPLTVSIASAMLFADRFLESTFIIKTILINIQPH